MRSIIILVFILITSFMKAQHNVTYDYAESDATRKITHWDTPKPGVNTVTQGDACTFTIKNINTFLYDVSVDGETISLNSDPPQAFQFFFGALNLTAEAAGVSSLAEAPKSNPREPKSPSERKLQHDNDSINDSKINYYTTALNDFRDNLNRLEAWKVKYDELLNTVQTDGKTGDQIIKEVTACMKDFTPASLVTTGMDNYKSTLESLQQVIDAIGQLPEEERAAKQDDLKKLLELQTKIEAFDYPAFFNRFSILYKQGINPGSYYVISPPIVAEKDYINFKISIQPRKDLQFAQPLRGMSFEYPVRVRNGFKVDFSSGIFFSFDEARGRTYRLDPVPGDSLSVMIAHNKPTAFALPSLGAAIHGSWRPCPSFAFGGMLGIGLNSTNITDANFYFGLSLIGGWRERFILNLGYALNHVDYLSKDFYEGQVFRKDAISTDKLTEKTYRGGPFIGLSFNITNKKQGQ